MSADCLLDVSSANPAWRIRVTPTTLSIDFAASDQASCAAIAERIDLLLTRSKREVLLERYVQPLSLCRQIVAAADAGNRS